MSNKTLSTSTLSLRFMQNAHRAKHLKEVELDRAEVKDDGHWEVAAAVREAWGISPDSKPPQSVIHETSYLPFLFPSKPDSSQGTSNSSDVAYSDRPRGRRTFDKKGREVESQPQPEANATMGNNDTVSPSDKKSRVHPNPRPISGSSRGLSGFPDSKPLNDAKTAKQAIYDNSGVGADLDKPSTGLRRKFPPKQPEVFLKPAGVDEPSHAMLPVAQSDEGTHSSNVIHGARAKVKSKRERDSTTEQPDGDAKKRKKKKKTVE